MIDAPVVRAAQHADAGALSHTLTRAFHTDPVVAWSYPNERRRPRSDAFFDWSLRRLLPQDVSWTTTGATGAALWALPHAWKESTREALQLVRATAPHLRCRAPMVGYGLTRVERHHPAGRHLYLAVLGVDPAHQGQGIGSALLQPGLALCDEEALPAYLETATERNVAFYGRHGFVVQDSLRLPFGPTMWTMLRQPR